MSKRAGRVGVANDQVDVFGRLKFTTKQISYILSEFFKWAEFKVWKGGTEQLLPVNTSTPTTTSMIADIKYPDQKRTNQNILYRESPTTEDGTATLEKVVGHSVSVNQLFNVINYSNTNTDSLDYVQLVGQLFNDTTLSKTLFSQTVTTTGKYANLFTVENTATKIKIKHSGSVLDLFMADEDISFIVNHKYYLSLNLNGVNPSVVSGLQANKFMLMDLTLMNIDNLTTTAQVEEWLVNNLGNIDYFTKTNGTLISFTGTGLKTVGFNQWDEEWEGGTIDVATGDNSAVGTDTNIRSKNYIPCLSNTTYYFEKAGKAGNVFEYRADKSFIKLHASPSTFTTTSETAYLRFYMGTAYGTPYNNNICINISDVEKNGTYEPYTTNTLSLPIATYFPTGMKSAGSVKDEMTQAKATTKIGSVDLGTLTYYIEGGNFIGTISDLKNNPYTSTTLVCSKYITSPTTLENMPDKSIRYYGNTNKIIIKDSSYADTTAFTTAMSGVMLYYELATPTEEPIVELD